MLCYTHFTIHLMAAQPIAYKAWNPFQTILGNDNIKQMLIILNPQLHHQSNQTQTCLQTHIQNVCHQ